jgi:hypothetical protein
MIHFLPYVCFRQDFDQMLEEGKRQEEINTANKGEYAIVQGIHTYFANAVMPSIIHNDWVFEAASKFATDYTMDYFLQLRLGGKEAFDTNEQLHKSNKKVKDFLRRAARVGGAPREYNLIKASNFRDLLNVDKLTKRMRVEAESLYEQVKDHERLQLLVTLRGIRDSYVTILPRIMYIVRRVMKVTLGESRTERDDKLLEVSESLGWYESHIRRGHELDPILVNLRDFYRIARNAISHPEGMKWDPSNNRVTLFHRGGALPVDLYEFQQKYRYLAVYLCDHGVKGILSAFCEREQGPISDYLGKEYEKSFPEGFPQANRGFRYHSEE